jgi:DHA1 family multidrug resistance protein-like MFS transporter
MLLRSGLCLALLYVASYYVRNPYALLGVRFLVGLFAGYIPAAMALVATNTPENNVGYALGVMSTANATGSIVGPFIGGLVVQWIGNRETFLFSAGLVFFSFFIVLCWVKEGGFDRTSKRSTISKDLKEALFNRRLLVVLLLVFGTTTTIMIQEPLLTVYVLQLGVNKESGSLSSGIIFSAVGAATVIAAPFWGRKGERIGHNKVLIMGLLRGGSGNLLQYFFPNVIAFGFLRFSYGLFFAGVLPFVKRSNRKSHGGGISRTCI